MSKMHKSRRRKEKAKRWIRNRTRPSRFANLSLPSEEAVIVLEVGTTKARRILKKMNNES